MSTPHKCPVCYGYGTVSKPPWIAGDEVLWVYTGTSPFSCPACEGTGIIWEPQNINVKPEVTNAE